MAKLATIRDEGTAAQINSNAVKMPNPANGISYLAEHYLKPREGEDIAQDMTVVMNAAPQTLRQFSIPKITQHTDAMVAEVVADRKGVYEAVSPEYAISVASNFLGDDNYKALRQIREKGGNAKAAFVALHGGNRTLAELVSIAPEGAVNQGADNALARTRTREMLANNILKPDGSINKAGTARYDTAQTSALPADERKEYDTSVGRQYAAEQDSTHFQ